MRIRLATAGLLASAVLASVLSVDVADPEPASAHTKTTQDCTWVQSTNYTLLRYDYDPDYVEWVEIEPGHGEYRYGRMVPVWGYERYKSCGPVTYVPHSHRLWIPAFVCPWVTAAGGAAGGLAGASLGPPGVIGGGAAGAGAAGSICGGVWTWYVTSGPLTLRRAIEQVIAKTV